MVKTEVDTNGALKRIAEAKCRADAKEKDAKAAKRKADEAKKKK